MHIELEKIANALKGVAGIILAMSEVPTECMKWNEWTMDLLYKELAENIEKLEGIALKENKVDD